MTGMERNADVVFASACKSQPYSKATILSDNIPYQMLRGSFTPLLLRYHLIGRGVKSAAHQGLSVDAGYLDL